MSRKQEQKRTVVIVLWLAGSAGRKQLTGILRYVNAGHPWSVQLITDPREFTGERIRRAERECIDGMIVHTDAQATEALVSCSIPTVLMDFPPPRLARRKQSIAVILDSDERIGEIAADYFLQLGNFASYAFLPDAEGRCWSRLRERGFASALRRRHRDCEVFRTGKLAVWLKKLPKPVALLSAYDLGARTALEACKAERLSVPGQIAILGVDNDELICDYASPSLSSVRIDHEALGFEAARILERLMRRPTDSGMHKVFMPADKVVERESTAPVAPAAHLVTRAQSFISAHASEGISVSDVVRHLGVSRRLADRRFGAVTGSTLRRAIEDSRLELVKRRLTSSSLSLVKIAHLCGYRNEQRLKYVFKKRFGCSMSEWRRFAFETKSTRARDCPRQDHLSPVAVETAR